MRANVGKLWQKRIFLSLNYSYIKLIIHLRLITFSSILIFDKVSILAEFIQSFHVWGVMLSTMLFIVWRFMSLLSIQNCFTLLFNDRNNLLSSIKLKRIGCDSHASNFIWVYAFDCLLVSLHTWIVHYYTTILHFVLILLNPLP